MQTTLLKWLCVLAGGISMSTYAEMAPIPAGSFTMGNAFDDVRPDELPLHSVAISSFYMESVEVTKDLWDEVYEWAIANGYSFTRALAAGKAPSHPVQTISWYDCLKWCNARSEKEELTPCYYTTAAQTTVYRSGDTDISNECVKWGAGGYRLPTEAEWEKAARGGAAGHRFSWSDVDTITHVQANYWSNDRDLQYPYDVSLTRGYHPAYNDGIEPYTSPVGAFAANGYGLYDMIGNVYEWCWDWYESDYYGSSPASDPRGSTAGTFRVIRSGDWHDTAQDCRTANRSGYCLPGSFFNRLGFRCARSNLDAPIPSSGPAIRANGVKGNVTVHYPAEVAITIAMHVPDAYVGTDVDWWVLINAGSVWYYLNDLFQWSEFDGNFSNCHPAYQGGWGDLAAAPLLTGSLPVGTYSFYFAVDYPMDGILNLDGIILADAVNVSVQ